MTYKEHFKRNIILASPVMVSQLGHVAVGMADSIMVGKLGVVPLAAVSLSNSIFYLLFMFGIGVSYAITPLIAQADGAKDDKKSSEILKHGLLVDMLTAFVLFLLMIFASYLLKYLNQPEDVVRIAAPYLRIYACSIIPFMLFQTFRQFIEGLSLTVPPMSAAIIANIINIGLNYVLIFGKFGIEPMGAYGAAWATVIARVLMAIILLSYALKSTRFKRYFENISWHKFSKNMTLKMLRMGVPIGLQLTFEVGAFTCAAIMVGWLGANALAAHQIALSLVSLTYMMATGIAAAATIRVGNFYGKKDKFAVYRTGVSTVLMAAIFMAFCGILLVVGRHYFPSLYIDNEEVVKISALLIVIAAIFQVSDGVQVVSLGALRGMGDIKIPTVITLVAYWVLALPIGYYLGIELELGAVGIWYGLLIGLTVAAILLFYRFYRLTRR